MIFIGAWGTNLLQNDTALDFAGKLMDMATALATENEEILVLYEMEKILQVSNPETLKKIKCAAIKELDKLDSWKLKEDRENRENTLDEIIDYVNERIDSYKETELKFDLSRLTRCEDTE